jgi:hypothetical protein
MYLPTNSNYCSIYRIDNIYTRGGPWRMEVMDVVVTVMVSWSMFVVGAIIYTRNFEKRETKLAKRAHKRNYN